MSRYTLYPDYRPLSLFPQYTHLQRNIIISIILYCTLQYSVVVPIIVVC